MSSRPARQYSDIRKSVFTSYVNANTTGPLSTNQYPCVMPPHNLGVLTGRHPNPPSFYPASNDSVNSQARFQYLNTSSPYNTPFYTNKTKYNAPIPSSMRTAQKKANAIGKSGYKVNLPDASQLSYKSYFPTDVLRHKKFVRSGGCVAPAKKGSIYNTSLRNGNVCCWGGLSRQTY